MRLAALLLLAAATAAPAQQAFTLQQILSAPYSTNFTAAPVGNLFAWVEHTEGRNNLFVGGPNTPARQLTHNTEDDAQDIINLAWSPDATAIAYTFGAQSGADGHPANPAHLQADLNLHIWLQPLTANAPGQDLGEGHAPLFTRDGHSLLFLRFGKVWIGDIAACALQKNCHPAPEHHEGEGSASGLCLSACHSEQREEPASRERSEQLIFDRGSAHDLTLSPDGHLLAYISRRTEPGQPSHTYLALFNLLTHALTFPAPSTANDSAPTFSPDGTQLAWLRTPFTQTPEYANPRTSPNPWSIQLLSLPQNCHPDPEHREGEGSVSPACSGTLSPPRTLFTPTPNQPGSVLPHLATGEPRLFFAAANRILFYSEADGWLHLYSLDPTDTKPPVLMTQGPLEVEDPIYDKASKAIFFSASISARNRPDHFPTATSLTTQSRHAADGLASDRRHIARQALDYPAAHALYLISDKGIETHPQITADGTLAALVSDASTPMHPALIDTDGSMTPLHLTPLTTANLVTPTQILLPSPLRVDSKDNLTLHAQLFLPPNLSTAQKHPAILFLHGGPNRQMLLGYPAMDYYSNAYAFNQYLTSRGFIVLSLNYRCGIGYGLDFRQCQNAGPNGAAEYNDVLAAAAYLRTRPDVDPTRIGLWGGSYGGYLTALALARNSNLFAAGVDFHGVHDWNLEANAGDWLVGNSTEKAALAARALAASPLADITNWTSPILLIHGDNDPDVAYVQTPILADALRARNSGLPPTQQVDIEELIFPDELHTFQLHRDWLAAYTAAANFFERTLKPIPTAPETVHSKHPSPHPEGHP